MRLTTTAIVINNNLPRECATVTADGQPAPTTGYSAHDTLDRTDTWHQADSPFAAIEAAVLQADPRAINVTTVEALRSCGNSTDYRVVYNAAVKPDVKTVQVKTWDEAESIAMAGAVNGLGNVRTERAVSQLPAVRRPDPATHGHRNDLSRRAAVQPRAGRPRVPQLRTVVYA